jgi:phosphotransferase system IIB component
MSLLDSATNAISTATKTLTDVGPASGLSGVLDKIGGAIGGALSSFGTLFKPISGIKLPLPNPLFAYASYDYILGIAALTDADLNFPDKSYRAGKVLPLICKSANADPKNRISTPYGKFDFFIDNLEITSTIGLEKGQNTNATGIKFDITEPYSMGMFMISCQVAAQEAGHDNWRAAPFLLTIDFRGNKETGQMDKIPETSRQIPFKFQMINMRVTQQGAVYSCEAFPYNQEALTTKHSSLKSDASIKGSTVQEVLQTGEQSLQVVINQRLQQLKKDGIVSVADEMLILFPNDVASETAPAAQSESASGATSAPSPAAALFKKLGIAKSTVNKTLVQPEGVCNALGQAKIGYDENRKGDVAVGKDNVVYDSALGVNVRQKNTITISQGVFKFSQDTDIPNAINQVLLSSEFPEKTFDTQNLSPEGYRGWWRIDVQTYNISATENAGTGEKAKLIVYRVVPYSAHSSRLMPPNTKAPGFEQLKKQAVKVYDYIYTGKNVDILKFDIEFSSSFSSLMASDSLKRTQDSKTASSTGGAKEGQPIVAPLQAGNPPPKDLGSNPTMVNYTKVGTDTDKFGGGGSETMATRAARLFHDAITTGTDMIQLNMEIIGDPYYIAQSGQGNYTSTPTQYPNLNSDKTINWQNGEVHIAVRFRTPIDINQTTGLYNFGGSSQTAPVIGFSGLYKINNVESSFKGGKFTQRLMGFRPPGQEYKTTATPDQTFSTAKVKEPTAEDNKEGTNDSGRPRGGQ